MNMTLLPVEFFVAMRYLKASKKNFFSLLTTFIAIGGTALGVAALVVTLAIMSGFQKDIRDKILGVQSHIIVTKIDGESFKNYLLVKNKIKTNKSVVEVAPFIYRQGIIRSLNSPTSIGVVIKAVEYKSEDSMLNFSKKIIISDEKFFEGKRIGKKSIILGNELAKNINVNAGDEVILMFPENFSNIPKMYMFTVLAIVRFGMYEFDSTLGFIDLDEGQRLFSMQGDITGLDVHTNNFYKVATTASELEKDFSSSYSVKTWIDMNKNLFSALRIEKVMMFLILGLIILVAAFNIISNLLLLSVQKLKEIGIMSAMGFSKFSISKIFFYEGISVGFTGTILGIILGLLISLALRHLDIFKLPKGVYYVDKLPVVIIPTDVLTVAMSAFLISVISGIYPAYQISKLDPLKAIKYK
ncbi:MAG: ABC transporter permease [Endomicrobium sp.]|jgi:lipoprotein-releasing system permease protein|nr:ABC transporter permease [Endomicrobium sp.]